MEPVPKRYKLNATFMEGYYAKRGEVDSTTQGADSNTNHTHDNHRRRRRRRRKRAIVAEGSGMYWLTAIRFRTRRNGDGNRILHEIVPARLDISGATSKFSNRVFNAIRKDRGRVEGIELVAHFLRAHVD